MHIGLAEELGSGTRELFKNSRLYTGRDPELEEGLIFRAFVPTIPAIQAVSNSPDKQSAQKDGIDEVASLALKLAESNGGVRTADLVDAGISRRTAQRTLSELVERDRLTPQGNGPVSYTHLDVYKRQVGMPGTVPALVYCQMAKSSGAVGASTSYSANHLSLIHIYRSQCFGRGKTRRDTRTAQARLPHRQAERTFLQGEAAPTKPLLMD